MRRAVRASLAGGGTFADNLGGDTSALIALRGSVVFDLTNLNLDVLASGAQTRAEYVPADHDVGSAFVTGTQFRATVMPGGWSTNYGGTTAHPGDNMLVVGTASTPGPASLGAIGLAAEGLTGRGRPLRQSLPQYS